MSVSTGIIAPPKIMHLPAQSPVPAKSLLPTQLNSPHPTPPKRTNKPKQSWVGPITVALSVLLLGTLAVVGFKAGKQVIKEAEEAEKLAETQAKEARRQAEAALQRKTEEARKKAEAKAEKTVEELWEEAWNMEPGSSHYSRTRTWTTSSTTNPQEDPWGNPSRGRSAENTRKDVKAEARRQQAEATRQAEARRQQAEAKAEAKRKVEEAQEKARLEAERERIEREFQKARQQWKEELAEELRKARERQARANANASGYSSRSSRRAAGASTTSWGSPKTSLIQRFNALANQHGTISLGENPTKEQLKTAYRQLSMKLHPDTSMDPKSTEDQFKQLSQIYTELDEYL